MTEFYITGKVIDVSPVEYNSSGIEVVNFLLDVERKGKGSKISDQLKISAFRDRALQARKCRKDSRVAVKGRLQDNNYRNGETIYYSPELIAEEILPLDDSNHIS